MAAAEQHANAATCDDDHFVDTNDEARLDALVGTLPGSVVYRLMMDPSGTPSLAYVSPTIEPNFGLPRDAVMTDVSLWYGLLHPDDAERVLAAQQVAFAKRDPFRATARYRLQGGEERLFELHASPSEQDDGCVMWNGVATDVTEAERLRAERTRLLNLIEATPDYVFVTRVDGTVDYANAAAKRLGAMVGKNPETMTLFDLHTSDTMRRFETEAFPALMKEGLWSGYGETILTDERVVPMSYVIVATKDKVGRVSHFASIARDRTEELATDRALREANERVQTTLREVNHRIKNFFALVPALVKLSARTAGTAAELSEAVQARIGALARSHDLTLSAFSDGFGIDLDTLIQAVLQPYQEAADAFERRGPKLLLSGRTGNAVSLALHELATNAAKHGVLSAPGGSVCIEWSRREEDEPPALRLTWTEDGGPPVEGPPTRAGFGTSLLDRLIAAQGGTISRDWRREGLRLTMTLPLT